MNVASKLICGIALCVLLGSAHAVGSPQVAMQLNARYSSTPAQCVGRAPAFACSGVLLRAVPASDVETFWEKDDAAQLIFLRKDRALDGLAAPSGFVLFDRLTAVGLGKPYQAGSSAGGVVVSTWNAQVPAQLPIQAIFYDVTRAGALAAAQRSQRAYFDATAQWLPVVRLHLGDGMVWCSVSASRISWTMATGSPGASTSVTPTPGLPVSAAAPGSIATGCCCARQARATSRPGIRPPVR